MNYEIWREDFIRNYEEGRNEIEKVLAVTDETVEFYLHMKPSDGAEIYKEESV